MQTIVIENRDHQQSTFLAAARQLSYLEIVGVFDQWEEAREFLLRQKVQLVVLDIQALREEGITMGRMCAPFFPRSNCSTSQTPIPTTMYWQQPARVQRATSGRMALTRSSISSCEVLMQRS